MQLKIKPASGTSLGSFASDLTQAIGIVNTMEGQKPLSLKLKIGYTVDDGSAPQSHIKIVNSLPTNY
jgi:hypothetical protein